MVGFGGGGGDVLGEMRLFSDGRWQEKHNNYVNFAQQPQKEVSVSKMIKSVRIISSKHLFGYKSKLTAIMKGKSVIINTHHTTRLPCPNIGHNFRAALPLLDGSRQTLIRNSSLGGGK